MKKLLITILIGTLTLTAVACGTSSDTGTDSQSSIVDTSGLVSEIEEENEEEEIITGGWTTVQEDTLPREAGDALEKAVSDLEGAVYEPVRLLAEQVVAGTNYAILCRVTPVVPDAEGSYYIVYVYEDLEGNAEIMRLQSLLGEESEGSEETEEIDGGWSGSVDEATEEAGETALAAALEGLVGAVYEPEAVVGTQVVSGTNYLILCKVTAVVPDAEGTYNLVTVYEDLEGNAEITDVTELEYSIYE